MGDVGGDQSESHDVLLGKRETFWCSSRGWANLITLSNRHPDNWVGPSRSTRSLVAAEFADEDGTATHQDLGQSLLNANNYSNLIHIQEK